jgi:hypothetical protein
VCFMVLYSTAVLPSFSDAFGKRLKRLSVSFAMALCPSLPMEQSEYHIRKVCEISCLLFVPDCDDISRVWVKLDNKNRYFPRCTFMISGRNSYLDITERDCVLYEVRAKAEGTVKCRV